MQILQLLHPKSLHGSTRSPTSRQTAAYQLMYIIRTRPQFEEYFENVPENLPFATTGGISSAVMRYLRPAHVPNMLVKTCVRTLVSSVTFSRM
jgi:hypothetical protein